MDERPLGIHEIKFVVEPSPSFGDGRRVADHAYCSRDFGNVRPGNGRRWLIIDSHFKSSGAPVHKLYGSLRFNGCNGGVDVLGDNITTVQHTAGHVFTVSWIALDHLVGWFETSVGDFSNGELFVVCLNMS